MAYEDTKARSISIADGAAQGGGEEELALICVVNLLINSGELAGVAANFSHCDNETSVGERIDRMIGVVLMV